MTDQSRTQRLPLAPAGRHDRSVTGLPVCLLHLGPAGNRGVLAGGAGRGERQGRLHEHCPRATRVSSVNIPWHEPASHTVPQSGGCDNGTFEAGGHGEATGKGAGRERRWHSPFACQSPTAGVPPLPRPRAAPESLTSSPTKFQITLCSGRDPSQLHMQPPSLPVTRFSIKKKTKERGWGRRALSC